MGKSSCYSWEQLIISTGPSSIRLPEAMWVGTWGDDHDIQIDVDRAYLPSGELA